MNDETPHHAKRHGQETVRRGVCLVLASAPGVGKTSVSRALLEMESNLSLSISATTRARRPGEIEGVHYFFVPPAEFEAMIARGDLLEYARFLDRSYGTPRAPVEAALAAGRDVLFDIEWQGHRQLREKLPGDVVGVHLLPPSMEELEKRLRGRAQEDEAEIARRLAIARVEIAHWQDFDHVLINRHFDRTVAEVRAILHAARSTRERQPALPGFVEGLLKR
jgi:guanylate kinase